MVKGRKDARGVVNMAHTETVGNRIARLRREKEIPQYQLANEIGLHPSSLNQIEKGHRTPKADTVAKLAKALGTTRDFLWDGNPAVAEPSNKGHAHATEPLEVSAVITQAVQSAIRATLTDLLNAVSESLAAEGRPQTAEREDRRPETKAVRARRP